MLVLRREFFDGPQRSELVLLHYEVVDPPGAGQAPARGSLVMPAESGSGRREVRVILPDPPPGGHLRLRYAYSTVGHGAEWFSPRYEVAVPGEETRGDIDEIAEVPPGNLRPAPGRGMFRLLLPLRDGEPRTGTVRYGFGAMRKKPSEELCRASVRMDGKPPVIELPEALSVLKNRPMPYFLYHVTEGGAGLAADKITSARITLKDETGEVLCARMLWGDPEWAAQNLSPMEPKNGNGEGGKAMCDYVFSGDPEAALSDRVARLARHPLPRTFEAYVYGPSGSVAEYCFQLLVRRPDGSVRTAWRNLDGGNWKITL